MHFDNIIRLRKLKILFMTMPIEYSIEATQDDKYWITSKAWTMTPVLFIFYIIFDDFNGRIIRMLDIMR